MHRRSFLTLDLEILKVEVHTISITGSYERKFGWWLYRDERWKNKDHRQGRVERVRLMGIVYRDSWIAD